MAKVRAGLLGVGAQGSLGGVISYRRRGRETIVERMPVAVDRVSYARLHQRMLYQDGVAYWRGLSQTVKADYEKAGRAVGNTGLGMCLSEFLREKAKCVAFWRLNQLSGATAIDEWPGSVNVPLNLPVFEDGVIDRALYFDGIDDRAGEFSTSRGYWDEDWTSEWLLRVVDYTGERELEGRAGGTPWHTYRLGITSGQKVRIWLYGGVWSDWLTGATNVGTGWRHVAFTSRVGVGGRTLSAYLDGELDGQWWSTRTLYHWEWGTRWSWYSTWWFKGWWEYHRVLAFAAGREWAEARVKLLKAYGVPLA